MTPAMKKTLATIPTMKRSQLLKLKKWIDDSIEHYSKLASDARKAKDRKLQYKYEDLLDDTMEIAAAIEAAEMQR